MDRNLEAKMLRTCILIILSILLFSTFGFTEQGKPWKGAVTEADLVKVVNFLINNKGKEIKLDGKKHTIKGKEELDVEITVLSCCDEQEFRKYIHVFGKVKDVKFPTFHARIPADKIPQIDKNGEVTEINFTPEAHDFWMNALKHGLKK
ncbi:MAG: hypothetical protein KJ666_08415 [Bacteroidetes bacterium]|nr:hypothetical protein [Bacteroidota bacterium]